MKKEFKKNGRLKLNKESLTVMSSNQLNMVKGGESMDPPPPYGTGCDNLTAKFNYQTNVGKKQNIKMNHDTLLRVNR